MNIFNHFQHIDLSTDQRYALEMLNAFMDGDERIFILKGYAGSGKTTLLKGVVDYLLILEKKFQLMAPTGRAAKVINQKTGHLATTIHKGIYSFDELHEIVQEDDSSDVSFLYQYKIRNNKEVHDSVLIIDEASMISDVLSQDEFFRFGSGHLLRDLFEYARIKDQAVTSKIILIGDPAQLPPIGMNFSPALDSVYLNEAFGLKVSTIEMKEVLRQRSDNKILNSALKIRQCLTSGYFNDFDLRENNKDIFNPPFQDYMDFYNAENGSKIIVCYKNKTALSLNCAIRSQKFGGEFPIKASDTVIIGSNNYRLGILNGEFGVVAEAYPTVETREVRFKTKGGKTEIVNLSWRKIVLVLPDENNQSKTIVGYLLENYLIGDNYLSSSEQRALYIDFKNRHPKLKKGTEEFKEAIVNDPYFNCILLKFGYAVTCHKAQGGEWQNAFVFWDKGVQEHFDFNVAPHNRTGKTNSDFYRWAYTAITRASQKLFCINPPYFSSFSEMIFIDINVQMAFNSLVGQSKQKIEVNYNEFLPDLQKFDLSLEPFSIQDHFIQRLYVLQIHGIELMSWQKVGYEIRYLFKKDNQTAAIKYWINGKNEFKANFQKLPGQTSSNQLYEEILDLLGKASDIAVLRTERFVNPQQLMFDKALEEKRPFLKTLFDHISKYLNESDSILDICHLDYRERYTFGSGAGNCVIDFEYDGAGFFRRVLPLENRCMDADLLSRIKALVNNLKMTGHGIQGS